MVPPTLANGAVRIKKIPWGYAVLVAGFLFRGSSYALIVMVSISSVISSKRDVSNEMKRSSWMVILIIEKEEQTFVLHVLLRRMKRL